MPTELAAVGSSSPSFFCRKPSRGLSDAQDQKGKRQETLDNETKGNIRKLQRNQRLSAAQTLKSLLPRPREALKFAMETVGKKARHGETQPGTGHSTEHLHHPRKARAACYRNSPRVMPGMPSNRCSRQQTHLARNVTEMSFEFLHLTSLLMLLRDKSGC